MLERPIAPDASLRLYEEADVDELHALIEAERAALAPWMPWAAGQTREGTLAFIRLSRRQLAADDGLQTAITVDGAIAGGIGVHAIDRSNRATSIGYWLAAPHQGRGLVTAAVRAYLDEAFGPWALERVELRAAVANARSRAIAERLGFTAEGVARSAELIGGRPHDLVVYSLLRDEWTTPA